MTFPTPGEDGTCIQCIAPATVQLHGDGYCDDCAKKVHQWEEKVEVALDKMHRALGKWLHYTDKEVVEIVLAVAIAERMPGDPLWLFLIAPPGGCKTELLRSLQGPDFYHLSDLTSKTFVSGLVRKTKDGEERKVNDLLPQLDGLTLIFKDFTTILEHQKEERQEIMAQLREIYDGSFAKKFGTTDEKIEYKSRFGLIAGVTPVIDRYWKVMQQLGERFLKLRWDEDSRKTTERAEQNEGSEKAMREDIREAVNEVLQQVKLRDVRFPPEYRKAIQDYAQWLAVMRTPVTIQNAHSDFYFDSIPLPERPTRLVKQLKRLAKAVATLRGHPVVLPEDMRCVRKVVESTCPPDRLAVYRAVKELQGETLYGTTVTPVYKTVKLPETSVRRICQQLFQLGVFHEETVVVKKHSYTEETTYYRLHEDAPIHPSTTLLEASNKEEEGCNGGIQIEASTQ